MTITPAEFQRYEKSLSSLKTQAILAIVFGALGILFSFLILGSYILLSGLDPKEVDIDKVDLFLYGIVTPIFLFATHVYYVVAGVFLLREPTPKVAKVLSIINIVVGAGWNLIILIFAALFLARSVDYERGHAEEKK